jgi:hypothetical protein
VYDSEERKKHGEAAYGHFDEGKSANSRFLRRSDSAPAKR